MASPRSTTRPKSQRRRLDSREDVDALSAERLCHAAICRLRVGHSTFSRTGAEVLTLFTGSEFFPGGIFEYEFPMGSGLDFEYGPTEAVKLQFATYFDASDQASISRIYGGIHPPADDFPGRRIGTSWGRPPLRWRMRYFAGVPEPAEFPAGHHRRYLSDLRAIQPVIRRASTDAAILFKIWEEFLMMRLTGYLLASLALLVLSSTADRPAFYR